MKKRPYVICHMTASIDQKVTGAFLSTETGRKAADDYYRIHRDFEADAFACGRVTMEGSFTNGWYPDLSVFDNAGEIGHEDYVPADAYYSEKYAVAFDRKGRLGWKESIIHDEDPGYDNSYVIEVLTENVPDQILHYYRSIGVAYIFAGNKVLNIGTALEKLYDMFEIRTLLLEGGSVLDGAFLKKDVIDELSLVTAPVLADEKDKPLFAGSFMTQFRLMSAQATEAGNLWMRYHSLSENSLPCLKLKKVAEAIEMADDFLTYYYDLKTGELESKINDTAFMDSEGEDEFDVLLEEDPDRFVEMPGRYDLHNSPYSDYRMMEAFIETQPMYKNKLGRAIQGKGAFRRFREAVAQLYLLDDWYHFQNSFRLEAAKWWCRKEGWHFE
ncbi:MAG: dihydrofolate reductase family protein [Solobacterium sp.]|nr:dihydrofolate reductase family protein [Solobacterium sp.]